MNVLKYILQPLLLCCLLTAAAQDVTTYDDRAGLSHWIVSGIAQDRQGFIWLSTWNGLNRYDGYEFVQVKAQPGDGTDIRSEVIRQMALDDEGNIVCRTTDGVFKLNTKTYKLEDLPSTSPLAAPGSGKHATLNDHEGNLWRVERYGVTKTSRAHHPAQVVSGTETVQARAFLKDNRHDGWWLATKEDECVRIYDRQNALTGYLGPDGRLHKEKTSFGYRAYCIVQTRNGDIWMGCKPGALLRLRARSNGDGYEIEHIDDKGLTCNIVYHIAEDAQGRLWLATFGGGVQCVANPTAASPTCIHFEHAKNGDKVRRVLPTGSGYVVGATTNGLLVGRIDPTDVSKSRFRKITRDGRRAKSLCNNATMDVVGDADGHVFVATENNGIDMIDESALANETLSFTHFNKANSSLTSDACLAMTARADGHFFVVCTDRVMDFNPANDRTTTYNRNFWNEASHFSEERALQLPDGSWLFGQEQGAYRATRHNFETWGYKPPLVFTELCINGRQPDLSICQRDTIAIGTDERDFSIAFAALDYTDNSAICYRSQLNNGPWSHASADRSLTFYNMQPGTYTLQIESTDRYGRWVDNVRQLVIVVEPHWYETLWARLLGWLLGLGFTAAVAYVTFYVRQLRHQRRELLEKYMAIMNQTNEQTAAAEAEPAPQLPPELSANDRKFLERVMKYVEENIGNSDANIDDMAASAATSRSNLNRKLRSLVGITAAQLLIDARMQKAMHLLEKQEGDAKAAITDVAYRCGYSDSRYFSRCFKQKYGVTPSGFIEQRGRH